MFDVLVEGRTKGYLTLLNFHHKYESGSKVKSKLNLFLSPDKLFSKFNNSLRINIILSKYN
jgi:hypothetical protein